MNKTKLFLAGVAVVAFPHASFAQSQSGTDGDGEIVVTAQKRAQTLNDVPVTVTVASGEQLLDRGIVDTADLGKVVSGFVYTPATYGQPVYVLRGVGLFDSGFGSSPTVSVYVDQVPLPFNTMTRGAIMDIAQVEVLKGPQGTLFGANNTGGSINYIAAKPTADFEVGGSVSYERFNKATVNAHVSGPLSDTLQGRLAFQGISGGAWQKSQTHGGELGDSRFMSGRLLLDWTPTDRLKVGINLNGFLDRGDTFAAQLDQLTLLLPQFATQALLASPAAPRRPRPADWNPNAPMRKDDKFYQASARLDYDLTSDLTLTSITAYSDIKYHQYVDIDALAVENTETLLTGRLQDFNQEVRLQVQTGNLIGLVGALYQHSKIIDNQDSFTSVYTNNTIGGALSLPFTKTGSYTHQSVNNYAIFANAEYKITPQLTAQIGGRYTSSRRHSANCTYDRSPGTPLRGFLGFLQSVFAPGVPQPPVGECQTLILERNFATGEFGQDLNEDNFSFRGVVDYKIDDGPMVFASVSRGYKAGVITNIAAAVSTQWLPAKQERLDAYEVGIKAPLGGGSYFNASAFYYDYANRQLRARILDPVFGLQERLITVPKTRVWGIEADVSLHPAEGLSLKANGTYLNSKINGDFTNFNGLAVFDQSGQTGNFKGSPLSYTPKFSGSVDVEYEWGISENYIASTGVALSYRSRDNASMKLAGSPRNKIFDLPSYATVDLRLKLSERTGRWWAELFGRNVTNKFYLVNIFQNIDERHRYAGTPATYGLMLGFEM